MKYNKQNKKSKRSQSEIRIIRIALETALRTIMFLNEIISVQTKDD